MLKFSKKILALILCISLVVPIFAIEKAVAADGNVAKIDTLRIVLRSGATDVNGDNVWVTDGYTTSPGHPFTFRVNYNASGTYDYEEGRVEIRIPKHILKNRNGEWSDVMELSVPRYDDPELQEASPQELAGLTWLYKEEEGKDYITIYNRLPVPSGESGYIEVSYKTKERTYEYIDYGAENDVSADFYAYMHVSQGSEEDGTYVEAEKQTDPINVYIDTNAKISKILKEQPQTFYDTWKDSWGTETKPANADEYLYIVWPIRSWITANQPYNWTIQDVFQVSDGQVIGYSTSTSNFKENYPETVLEANYETGNRYDYVLTAIPKANYEDLDEWTVKNTVRGTVTPIDGVDPQTSANSSTTWKYVKPKPVDPVAPPEFTRPAAYNSFSKTGTKTSYQLDSLAGGLIDKIQNLTYSISLSVYTWEYTKEGSGANPEDYGKNNVKFILEDDLLKLRDKEGGNIILTPEDASFASLTFGYSIYDALYDEDDMKFVTGSKVTDFDESEVLDFFVKQNGTYKKAGTFSLKDKTWSGLDDSVIESATASKITFSANNIEGYKFETSNKRYRTVLTAAPSVTLHGTERVIDFIGEDLTVYLDNTAKNEIKDYTGKTKSTRESTGTDPLHGIITHGHIGKDVVSYKNSPVKKNYTVRWRSGIYETVTDDDGKISMTTQESGVFYDLLPLGGEFKEGSVKVYKNGEFRQSSIPHYTNGTEIPENKYTVEVVQDWNKSGRDMVIVRVNDPAQLYTMELSSVHSWANLKDYGMNIKNDIAYETGNPKIGDGETDGNDPFGKLDDDVTDEKRFLYSHNNHQANILTNAHLNLKKQVRASTDEAYSYDTKTHKDSDYYYKIRFANDDETKAKDLVVVDSLENYVTATGDESEWRGTLKNINVKELETLGCKPVIYYCTIPEFDLDRYKDDSVYKVFDDVLADEINGKRVWVPENEITDLSEVKAFMVDARKKANGSDFVLGIDQGAQITVTMHSPEIPVSDNPEAKAYNNIYLWNTIISKEGFEQANNFINQDFTTIQFVMTQDISFHKVSSKDPNVDVPNTVWTLTEDSVLGNSMNRVLITDENGRFDIKGLEVGTYKLMEVITTPDWFRNTNEYTVEVKPSGDVVIEGLETEDSGAYILENDPRIHGDIEFTKMSTGGTIKHVQATLDIIEQGPGGRVQIDGVWYNVISVDRANNKAEVQWDDYTRATEEQLQGVAYAVHDRSEKTLTFFRDERGKYSNNQVIGSKTYYTNVESLTINGSASVPWDAKDASIKKVIFEDYFKPTTMACFFSIPNLEEVVGIEKVDTSNCKSFWAMFAGARSLTTVDLSHFDTSKVENMSTIFNGCSALTYVDLTHFDTSKVSNMNYLFSGCNNLTASLNIMRTQANYGSMCQNAARDSGQVTLYYISPVTNSHINTLVSTKQNGNVVNGGKGTLMIPVPTEEYDLSTRASIIVPDAKFLLSGISDYGTEYNEYCVSGTDGKVKFANIEKGTYTLVETKAADNYINPKIKYTVKIDGDGNVSITGEDYIEESDGNTYLKNAPYTSFSLRKVDKENGSWLADAEFNLSGTSDFGKAVNIDVTSNGSGRVVFENLEPGSYILKETKAPDKYATDLSEYVVKITDQGTVLIEGLENEDENTFRFPNERGQEGKIKIIKKWEDGLTGKDAENREAPIINISTEEPEGLSGVSVTLKWNDYDHISNRPDNVVLHLVDANGNVVETSDNSKWIKNDTAGTWQYDFTTLRNDYKQYYVYQTAVSEYNSDADGMANKKAIVNGKATIYEDAVLHSHAVLDADGNLVMFKSFDKYTNAGEGTFTDIKRNQYTGRIFTDIDKTDTTDESNQPWRGYKTSIKTVSIAPNQTIKPINTKYWFAGCVNITSFDLTRLDTSADKNMSYMFQNCSGVSTIDVSHFDTSNVTTMNQMFNGCSNLESIDVSHFDTGKVTDLAAMFRYCRLLTSIDVSHFDTSTCKYFDAMFYDCPALTDLDTSHFDTSKAEYMDYMFYACRNVTTSLNIMGTPWKYTSIGSGVTLGYITLYYIDPATSEFVDKLVASSNVVHTINGGEGTFVPPDKSNVWNASNPSPVVQRNDEEDTPAPGNFDPTDPTNPITPGGEGIEYSTVDNPEGWVRESDGTWSYTFDVFDDEAQFYAWEALIPDGYMTDTSANDPQIINEPGSLENHKTATIRNMTPENYQAEQIEKAKFSGVSVTKNLSGENIEESDRDKKFAFDIEFDGSTANFSATRYSHTPNVSDSGVQSGNYSNSMNTNEVITIEGANTLTIDLYCNGESTSYDWCSVWAGKHPDYFANNNRLSEGYVTPGNGAPDNNNKFGGSGSGTYEVNGNTLTSMNYTRLTIPGDSVTFGFRSDGSGVGKGYGYYAVVTGESSYTSYFNGDRVINGVVFKNGKGTVYLRDGETWTAENIPIGTTYKITEKQDSEFELASAINNEGVITAEEGEAIFTNTKRTTNEETGGFVLKKETSDETDDSFTFNVSLSGLTPNKSYSFTKITADNTTEAITAESDDFGGCSIQVSLKRDDKVLFYGLPIDSKYSVSEDAIEGWKPAYVITEAGDKWWNIANSVDFKDEYNTSLSTKTETVEEDEDITVTFTNSKEEIVIEEPEGGFTVRKTVQGEGASEDDNFTFVVNLSGLEPETEYTTSGAGTFESDENGNAQVRFSLKHGDSAEFVALPEGTVYSVTETGNSYEPSYKVTEDVIGTKGQDLTTPDMEIVKEEYPVIEYTNTKDIVETCGFKVTKNVKGNLGDVNEDFEFTAEITGLDANTEYEISEGITLKSDSDGKLSIDFTLKDNESIEFYNIPVGAKYKVTEQASRYNPSYEIVSTGDIVKESDSAEFGQELATAEETAEYLDEVPSVNFTNSRDTSTVTDATDWLFGHLMLLIAGILGLSALVIGTRRRFKKF